MKFETAIREGLAKDKEADRKKEEREEADLQAQRGMVYWAGLMFWATVGGVSLTAVGVVVCSDPVLHPVSPRLLRVLRRDEARKATGAAEATNKIVARSAALELRAYLSVIPAGVNELIGSQQAMGHVDVKNVGKLPARNVCS